MRKPSAKARLRQDQTQAILAALNEDLALPLLQIKNSLDLLRQGDYAKPTIRSQAAQMTLSVDNGLYLIEAYRLALQAADLAESEFEPVAVGAVLQDVAHSLSPYAKAYNTSLAVDVQGRLTPVLTHKASLRSVLKVLGSSLIRAQVAQSKKRRYQLLLAAHRTNHGAIAAGAFSDVQGLSDKTLRSARQLAAHARQPLPALPPGSASGILIADLLSAAMWQPLRSAAHRSLNGLATSVPISQQLELV